MDTLERSKLWLAYNMDRERRHRIFEKLAAFVVPGLENSLYKYKRILDEVIQRECEWLDLGCGHDIIPPWVASSIEWQSAKVGMSKFIVGIDASYSSLLGNNKISLKVQGDVERLPFKEHMFSVVTSNWVVEHVRNPKAILEEVFRVLKPGGLFIFHTVNLFGYYALGAALTPEFMKKPLIKFLDGRNEKDVFPTAYRMNRVPKLNSLAHAAGFHPVDLRCVETTAQFWMLGPLVLPELVLIRMLRMDILRGFRTNIIGILTKPT